MGHSIVSWLGLSLPVLVSCSRAGSELLGGDLVFDDTLQVVAEIRDNDTFIVSGAVGTENCGFILAAQTWGKVIRINGRGEEEADQAWLQGNPSTARFSSSSGSMAFAWSHHAGSIMMMTTDHLQSTGVAVPIHPWDEWGEGWVGPVVALSGGRMALAPFGDNVPRAQPDPWIPTPIAYILDSAGVVVGNVGSVDKKAGRYLSWVHARSTIGSVGDTLMVLEHASARLKGFHVSTVGEISEVWSVQLPVYFRPQDPTEEVAKHPWIQVGGESVRIRNQWHVAAATSGEDGTMYAVRTYIRDVKTVSGASRGTPPRGLEIYDRRGVLLGRYALPDLHIEWLRVDRKNRLLIRTPGKVLVALNPAGTERLCPQLPGVISIDAADLPPSP